MQCEIDNISDPGIEDWLTKRLIGYPKNLLTTIVALVLAGRPVLLVGRHGLGKNSLCDLLSQTFYDNSWVAYDATKADLVNIAGLPDVRAMSKGKMNFVKHKNSLWDKRMACFHEITRATSEFSNWLLEVLEERTLYGEALALEAILATCNPATSYAGALELDDALLDRFAAIMVLPDFQDATPKLIAEIANVNLMPAEKELAQGSPTAPDPCAIRRNLRVARNQVLGNSQLTQLVVNWAGAVISALLLPNSDRFVTPRTWTQLARTLIDLSAYHLAVGRKLDQVSLLQLAEWAAHFCLKEKLKLDGPTLDRAVQNGRQVLQAWEAQSAPDAISRLGIGDLAERVDALIELGKISSSAADLGRIDALTRSLIRLLMQSNNHELVCGVWQSIDWLPSIQRDLEITTLADFISGIDQGLEPLPRQKNSTRSNNVAKLRKWAAKSANWEPHNRIRKAK
jgi:MoxR-like ATPase